FGFPALRAPAHFASRVMKPIVLEKLPALVALGTSDLERDLRRDGYSDPFAADCVLQRTTFRLGNYCVRWYLSFKLSSRDLVRMMAERGVVLAHTTILRWVQRYVPEFEKSWSRYARDVDRSWRCDETYIKVRGHWTYLYRAVDKGGRTVDFLLSERRDVAAAKCFFTNAIRHPGTPHGITR